MSDEAAVGTETPPVTDPNANETALLGGAAQPPNESGESPPETPAADEKEAPAPAGAPEAYELKAPEGGDPFDESVQTAFEEAVRGQNITNDGAQSILDKVLPALAERAAARSQEIRNGWADEARADKEIGGSAFDETLKAAHKGLERFGTERLNTWLGESGAGNHPELIRLLAKAGRAIGEEKALMGSTGAGEGALDLSNPGVQAGILYKKTE